MEQFTSAFKCERRCCTSERKFSAALPMRARISGRGLLFACTGPPCPSKWTIWCLKKNWTIYKNKLTAYILPYGRIKLLTTIIIEKMIGIQEVNNVCNLRGFNSSWLLGVPPKDINHDAQKQRECLKDDDMKQSTWRKYNPEINFVQQKRVNIFLDTLLKRVWALATRGSNGLIIRKAILKAAIDVTGRRCLMIRCVPSSHSRGRLLKKECNNATTLPTRKLLRKMICILVSKT